MRALSAIPFLLLLVPACSGGSQAKDPKAAPVASQEEDAFGSMSTLDQSLSTAEAKLGDQADRQAIDEPSIENALRLYLTHREDMTPKQQARIMSIFISVEDERLLPAYERCLAVLLLEHAEEPGDLPLLLDAYATGHLAFLAPAIHSTYVKYRVSTAVGGKTYKWFNRALMGQPRPEWEDTALRMLSEPMAHPKEFDSRDDIKPHLDQLFWQVSAAQLLGELRSERGIEPLIKVLLDPRKEDVAVTALLALVKIGRPAVRRAAAALAPGDPLATFAKSAIKDTSGEEPQGNPALEKLVAIIGTCGLADGVPALLALLQGELDDEDRALVARELPKLPKSAATKQAFEHAFEAVELETTILGVPALQLLAEAAADFLDPDMVDWMLKRASAIGGGSREKLAVQQALVSSAFVQQALVSSAIKVAKVEQWPAVSAAAEKFQVSDFARTVEPVVMACRGDVACYLAEVQKPDNQTPSNQAAGMKAAYMLGVLGGPAERDALVAALPSLENAAVHGVALKSIDALTPTSSPELLRALNEQVAKNEQSEDAEDRFRNTLLKRVLYRISAR